MADLSQSIGKRRVCFQPTEELEPSGSVLDVTAKILLMSLVAIPLTFCLNSLEWMHGSHGTLIIPFVGVLVLCFIVLIPYLSLRKMKDSDPILNVVSLFMFSSAVDLVIGLENDDIIADFVTFYLKEGEPQLKTAHGTMMTYWDGLVHYGIWLMILAAISWGESYQCVGLFWVGSFTNSIFVFTTGSIIGKFTLRWAMILSIPYIVLPFWIGYRLLSRPRNVQDKASFQQTYKSSIMKRPVDLLFIVYFFCAGAVDIFRGCIVLGCQEEVTIDYSQQFEPYLLDPSAYPKIQMLIYMFYFVPFYIAAVYGLLNPTQTWLKDWSLVYAGAAAQGQFTHIGSSLHSRTPFKLRVPSNFEACTVFWLVNGSLFLVPQLFAYRQKPQDESTDLENKQKHE